MTIEKLHQKTSHLKVAIIHDWAFLRRGGERVVEQIADLFPQADIYFLFGTPERALKLKNKHDFYFSFLGKIPFIEKIYKLFLPLLPIAIEAINLQKYDLLLSSSSCVAKGVIPNPNAVHISYIHSPMRYAWDQEYRYFNKAPAFSRPIELLRRIFLSNLRRWDVTSAARIDCLIANSKFVARRCQLYYGKKAEVVYPPVAVQKFINLERKNLNNSSEKTILLFGAWVPYKKMKEALEFLLKNNFKVFAAGNGKELEESAQKHKNNSRVKFFLNPSEEEIIQIYSESSILFFPAIEDFGIVVVEAMAAGLWIVAPNVGGTKETVINDLTGTHFTEGNEKSMLKALQTACEKNLTASDLINLRTHAQKFSENAFQINYAKLVYNSLEIVNNDTN